MPQTVQIVEVAPRDGLQNEERILDTATKVALIHRAMDAGARRIEAVSFVHPRYVPAMADAEDVIAAVELRAVVSMSGRYVHRRGIAPALHAVWDEVSLR